MPLHALETDERDDAHVFHFLKKDRKGRWKNNLKSRKTKNLQLYKCDSFKIIFKVKDSRECMNF